MKSGVVIFAYNNEHIDYVAMAAWSAKNIQRHLGLPVSLITDVELKTEHPFDRVIITKAVSGGTRTFTDLNATVPWYNASRTDAYALSPYDTTLVLDADYVVASDQLSMLLKTNHDFLCHDHAYDITGLHTFEDLNYFGRYKMPMLWATVMKFNKSKTAELVFDSMQMIKQNWKHYRQLYSNPKSTYRNDHALSIALNIVNGHALTYPNIPWSLASLIPDHKLTQISQDKYRVDFSTPQKQNKWMTIGQDFHAMGKGHLGAIVANSI